MFLVVGFEYAKFKFELFGIKSFGALVLYHPILFSFPYMLSQNGNIFRSIKYRALYYKVTQRCSTCQIRRDGVLSTRYGRKRRDRLIIYKKREKRE
jgi:hypothetical protein